jgi:hypothetical protein
MISNQASSLFPNYPSLASSGKNNSGASKKSTPFEETKNE